MPVNDLQSLEFTRFWYGASIDCFLSSEPAIVLGQLSANCEFAMLPTQRDSWLAQIELLRVQLLGLTGSIYMEFKIPRMGRRIDVVIIVGDIVFVIEFKVGAKSFDRSAVEQVWDYALDLKNFHEASHVATIVPIVAASEVEQLQPPQLIADEDNVYRPVLVRPDQIRDLVAVAAARIKGGAIDPDHWSSSSYHPTPTIIEAARSLYANHSVEAIARFDAGARNLRITSERIEQLIDEARLHKRKLICFVTGVPGAGKTLVGLNVATRRRDVSQPTHAVFLSGNGPLVAVLREALTRDEVARRKSGGEIVRKSVVGESVKAFIQNVHHFRDDLLVDQRPPAEHVAIFDEAQRAWNLERTSDFMRRKKNYAGFSQSEPEFLISTMDRHKDWAVVVCLVGGGQEINLGEAGIDSWIDAICQRFEQWEIHISSRLADSEYGSGRALAHAQHRQRTFIDDSLHLAVSMRSFRAEHVSGFVKALIDCDRPSAQRLLNELTNRYSIVVTRDINRAKHWILSKARGSERFGILASSKAHRLKPDAIDIRVDINPVHWFLNDRSDTRSSYYLEDAATEFQVQGLELDWTCVAWDGDLRFDGSGWDFNYFRGDRWCKIANSDNRRYLCNAYRVLLTRARQGMVIYMPSGDQSDPTRTPKLYDSTFNYLVGLGISEI